MTARFGRNKRRAAREQISQLQTESRKLRRAQVMDRGLLANQGEVIARLRYEIETAREIAGQMSVLFPPTRVETDVPPGDLTRYGFNVGMTDALDASGPTSVDDLEGAMMAECGIERLDVMIGRIDKNALRSGIHCVLTFKGEVVGLAISEAAIRSQPVDVIRRNCFELLSKSMGTKLAKALQ